MKVADQNTRDLVDIYRKMKGLDEKVDRSDVKRIATKSETDISNTDVKEFVRELSGNTNTLKKVLMKASTLSEKTPELEMFVVAYNNLLKVLEDKKKVQTEE